MFSKFTSISVPKDSVRGCKPLFTCHTIANKQKQLINVLLDTVLKNSKIFK